MPYHWTPTGEAVAFAGLWFQAGAVYWVWRDWKLSQDKHNDWKKRHRNDQTQTLAALQAHFGKFAGGTEIVDLADLDTDALLELAQRFPGSGDDRELTKRKIDHISQSFGVGPTDGDLVIIKSELQTLALMRRGWDAYRSFIRRRTFTIATWLVLIGFGLQIIGTWPSQWVTWTETLSPTGPAAVE